MYYDPIGNLLGTWAMGDELWAIALRLLLALLFGAVLGCERAAKRHAAGLRTFVLVCLSGTAAMTLDRAIGSLPVISAAVVLGIAIISTNSILFSSKSQIRGLTTATGLWSCSLLGLALGAGLIVSYVPQDASFLHGGARDYARNAGVDETMFLTLLRKLGFERVQFEKDMADYSAGQKKKVLLARSLCESAHLYLWDEPLNYIDVLSRMQIEQLLLDYRPTMLFEEHDAAFVRRAATGTLVL